MPAKKVNKFIQKLDLKPDALRNQLHIPKDKNIPFTLLEKIVDAKIGDIVENPTMIGDPFYNVTRLLHERAVIGLRLKRISQKRFNK